MSIQNTHMAISALNTLIVHPSRCREAATHMCIVAVAEMQTLSTPDQSVPEYAFIKDRKYYDRKLTITIKD